MTREFKVGDEVVMEADVNKGKIDVNPGIYKGIVRDVTHNGSMVEAEFEGVFGVRYFNIDKNSSISIYPGLSIRHADEVSRKDETMWRLTFLKDWRDIKSGTVFEGVKLGNNNWIYFNNGKCAIQSTDSHIVRLEPIPYGGNGRTVDVVIIDDMMPTPQKQEWVRGQAPEVGERETAIWLWKDGWEKPLYYTAIEKITIFSYTHWRYAELPPPPPVEEVEAYGILERYKQICADDNITKNIEIIVAMEKAADFFSLPATAENLNKYLTTVSTREGECWGGFQKDYTLDQWINWYKSQKDWDKLIFTTAALEALGVK